MTELTTNHIYQTLADVAIDKENKKYKAAVAELIDKLGIGGTNFRVTVPDIHDVEVVVRPHVYLDRLVKALIEDRRKKIEQKAAEDFIKSVETFKQHLSALETYHGLSDSEG